ncbi:type II toxin-antitoxin system RelE/ParE family toxin [Aphanothece sacrum]|uniref:Plasmid maintenance system killer protein n=1 Tax=Aphanothece sacrum FPU1 TaxID=1920663 RepID=A0A401IHD0_APHSA|nr:type II toxin-antitoxin system RelE/ParE family toxin [Aphanothece sacrum]GBF80644.1 plasmid maintenance system killer protein [Aphanothece sacrum FPU1]GBF87185.1 plasmid maintenance system killer protein [Aphanothece sacrum FPU3]
MIISFGNQGTSDLFNGVESREARKIPSQISKTALKKLDILNAAEQLDELKVPPGNRLEALKGNLKGFYSIRINSQWRIIFQWDNGKVTQVQIIDYHS